MSKAPKLRFKEFSGDWEEKKLGKLGEFKKTYSFSRNVEGEGNYKHIHYGDIHMNYNGIISKDKYIPSIDIPSDDSYEFIKERDIIFADASEDRKDLGKVAVVRDIEGNVLSGLHTICFRPNESLNSEFFLNHSLNKEYLKFMYTRGNGAKVLGISKSNLSEYKFLAPSKEEQEKIASFFSLIDDKISLQGEKLEMLKDYKRGMMQKIFSRELRFKDDEGRDYPEWEEKKLGEIANITMGQSPSSACYNEEYIGLPLIQGNADVKDRKTEPRVYTSEITKTCDIGDIIMSVRAPVGAISMSLHNACIGRGVCSIKPRYNVEYVYQFLLKYESKWSQVSQGSTFESVNSNDIKSLKILFPNLDEQNKIGNFLKNIDKRIEKEQEKLDSLNEYKKGLLQQMFV